MPTNYALTSNGTTVSTDASGTASRVIDGLRHTNNSYAGYSIYKTGGFYVILDFGQARTIGELRAYGVATALNYTTDPTESETSSFAIKNYKWEYWDGGAWQVIVNNTANSTLVVKVDAISPVTTDKVRFTVLTSADGWGYLAELEAWSPPPDTTPPTDCEIGTVTVLSSSSIRVPITTASTDSGDGMKRYKYEIDTQNDFLSGSKITGYTTGTTSPFDIPGLSPGFAGFVHFKGEDNASPSNFSNNWSTARAFTTWNAAPTITNATQLSNAQLGQSYDEVIGTAGGNGTRVVSETAGHSLPAWLTLVNIGGTYHLQGTHNSLATDELIYLTVTDANGQYTDYVLELTTVDTVVPTDVPLLVATKIDEFEIDINGGGSTDASGSLTYVNQRSNDNFVSNIEVLATTSADFTDTPGAGGTFKYRQKAKDGSNNVSDNWTYSDEIELDPPIPPLNYGFMANEVELFCEASNLALADNANVTSFTDQSVNARHLVTGASYPVNKTNQVNGKAVVRFNNSNALARTASFNVRCGWIVVKCNESTFSGYSGLLSSGDGILCSEPTGTKWQTFAGTVQETPSHTLFEYRLSDRIQTPFEAPMNVYKLIFFRFWIPLPVTSIRLGDDRGASFTKFKGDVALLILTSRDFCESEIRAKSQAIATAYGLTLADVIPYQGMKKDAASYGNVDVNIYDPPEGERIVEIIGSQKRGYELSFEGRSDKEFKAMREYHAAHLYSPACLYRDYNILPPEDVEGYIDSPLSKNGAINSINYSFNFKEK
jgi:hypothetical protein